MTYVPIRRAKQLENLDDAEMLEGYRDGFKNEPEPKGNRSISYWHGWRNGAVDGGYREIDSAQGELARDYVAANLKNNIPTDTKGMIL